MSHKPAQDFLLFLVGGSLFAAGIVLFTQQVMVATGSGVSLWGFGIGRFGGGLLGGGFGHGAGQGFGLLMIPFGAGVALLLADMYRRLGWFLVWATAAAITVLVLQSLIFSFRPASLLSLLSMVIMVAGGGGLMFRSLRDYRAEERTQLRTSSDETRRSLQELREELERLRSRLDRDAP